VSKREKLITLGGGLCIGAAALAFALPIGATVAAAAVTGLVAFGVKLRDESARLAIQNTTVALLRDLGPEYPEHVIEAATHLLEGLEPDRDIALDRLAGTWERGDFAEHCASVLIDGLRIGESEPALRNLLHQVFVASFKACQTTPLFREGLTAALVEKTAGNVNLVLPKLEQVLADTAEIKAMVQQLLNQGGVAGVVAEADHLPLAALQELATRFGQEGEMERAALLDFLSKKAEEYRALKTAVEHIDERVAGLGNLKAAARDAMALVDLEEVETLLARVDEVETEVAAESKELRAQNALLRGRVDEAFTIYVAAADSFGSVDPREVARRRDAYREHLYQHCLRYGGTGFQRAIDLVRPMVTDALRAADPALWGSIQSNLGNALQEQGKRTGGVGGTALLAQAVDSYRAAQEVRTRAAHPVDWAITQNNLANALQNQGIRTVGAGGAALLAQAVDSYRAALEVRTRAEHPVDWAGTQNNLAIALEIQGRRTGGAGGTALLAQAVDSYRAALEVRTRAEHPVDWAGTQNNLAGALHEQGKRTAGAGGTALLAQAVDSFRAAQEVYTRAEHPVHWALTQENLAIAELALARHGATADPRPHLQAALGHVTAALEVYDPEHMPYDHGTATALRDEIAAALSAL